MEKDPESDEDRENEDGFKSHSEETGEGCDAELNDTRRRPSKRPRLDEAEGIAMENPAMQINEQTSAQTSGPYRPGGSATTSVADGMYMQSTEVEPVQNDGHVPHLPGPASAPSESLHGNTGDDTHTAAMDTGRDWEAEFNPPTKQELIFGGTDFREWEDGGMEFP